MAEPYGLRGRRRLHTLQLQPRFGWPVSTIERELGQQLFESDEVPVRNQGPADWGVHTFRRDLAAFQFHGDSMIGDNIRHGDTGIFELVDLETIRFGKAALVEKGGEEEGTGAWAIKRIVLRQPQSYVQNEWGEMIDWNDAIIELHSSNPCIPPLQLDPNRRYRVRGYLVRVLRPEDVETVLLPDGFGGWPKARF